MRRHSLTQKGFTIIELLIATVVFSLVLLVVTGAIVQFSRIYYKGVVVSRTQAVARNVTNDVTQTIQFAGAGSFSTVPSGPVGGVQAYCIGDRTYTFKLSQTVSSSQHGLVVSNGNGCGAPSFPANGTEMLDTNMELVGLAIQQVAGNLYNVDVQIAYGPSTGANPDVVINGGVAQCRNALIAGGQFCAATRLTTTVEKRL